MLLAPIHLPLRGKHQTIIRQPMGAQMRRRRACRSPIVSVVYYGHMSVRKDKSEPFKQNLEGILCGAAWGDFEADAWDPSPLGGDRAP